MMKIIGKLKSNDFLVLFEDGFRIVSKEFISSKLSDDYSVPVWSYSKKTCVESKVETLLTREGNISKRIGKVFNNIVSVRDISKCPFEGRINSISLGFIYTCKFVDETIDKEFVFYYIPKIDELFYSTDKYESCKICILFDNPFVFYACFDGNSNGLVPIPFVKRRGILVPLLSTQGYDFLNKILNKIDAKEHYIPFINLITSSFDYSGAWKKRNVKRGMLLKTSGHSTLYNCLVKAQRVGQGVFQEGNVFVKKKENSISLKVVYSHNTSDSSGMGKIIEGDYDAVNIAWIPTTLSIKSKFVRLGKTVRLH